MLSTSTPSQKSIKAEAAATDMNVNGMAIVLAVILCATAAQGTWYFLLLSL